MHTPFLAFFVSPLIICHNSFGISSSLSLGHCCFLHIAKSHPNSVLSLSPWVFASIFNPTSWEGISMTETPLCPLFNVLSPLISNPRFHLHSIFSQLLLICVGYHVDYDSLICAYFILLCIKLPYVINHNLSKSQLSIYKIKYILHDIDLKITELPC